MSTMEAVDKLNRFLERARHVNVVVVAGPDGDDERAVQRLTLHEDVAEDFREAVRGAASLSNDTVLKAYDPGYKPERHEVCWVELSDETDIEAVVEDVADVDGAELFEADDDIIDDLRFYAVVVSGDGGKRAVFFRSYNRRKELSRRGGFALMMQSGTYNRVRNKIFLFDDKVDCFVWDGVLYIRNVTQFQRIFEYFERLKEKAEQTIKGVSKRVPISNLDEFQETCTGHPLMLSKLASIARKPYLKRVRMDDIKRAIEEFDLDIDTLSENGQEQLVFDSSREARWLILKLLDDDYLGSIMTNEKYEVNSKTRI